jgi:UDP-glucuronate 4-epimerase
MPFSEHDATVHPIQFYAATKRANELMAHAYSHLFALPTTGLRFFTVYGPWGRPDMALFKFTRQILAGEPIEVYGHGKHTRDFTYVDDIAEAVIRMADKPAEVDAAWDGLRPDPASSAAPWRVYNLGNNDPVDLMDLIRALESALGKQAQMEMLPLQPGDVPDTYADVSELEDAIDYRPATSIEEGVQRFVNWYRGYYG